MSQTNSKDRCAGRDDRDIDRRSSDDIKHDIDRTLSSMDQTVTQLQGRMTVRGIVNEITGGIAEHGGATGIASKVPGRVWEAAKHNPIPAALMGLGVAWLVADRLGGRGRNEGYEIGRGRDRDWLAPGAEYFPDGGGGAGRTDEGLGEGRGRRVAGAIGEKIGDVRGRASDAVGSVRERVSGASDSVRERVSGISSSARERVGHMRERAGDMTHRAREKLHDVGGAVQTRAVHLKHQTEDLYEESPLAFGAAALAVGLMGGLLVPATRKEEELMGEASGRFKEKAREIGQSALHQGAEVAKTIKQEVVGEGDEGVVDKAKEVVRSVIGTGREQIKQKVQSFSSGQQGNQQDQQGGYQPGRPGQGQDIGGQTNVD